MAKVSNFVLTDINNCIDFNWSLKPLVTWMKVFGTKIDVASSKTKFLFKIYGFVLLCNTLFHSLSTLWVVSNNIWAQTKVVLESNVSTERWKNHLYSIFTEFQISACYNCLYIIIHIVTFCLLLSSKWETLWCILTDIHKELHLSDTFHWKVRRCCCVGVALWILV